MTNRSELVKVEDEAADWAVLLADEPNDDEQLRRFRIWLGTSPMHAEVWARTRRVYEGLGQLDPATQARWRVDHNALPNGDDMAGASRFRGSFVRLVDWKKSLPGLALAVCLMVVFVPHLVVRLSADYLSGTGEQETHLLSDGSTLTLAPKSAVSVAYADGARTVRLLKGTAFFEVEPDADRPFSVEAGGTRTTVLGTAFSVDKADNGAVVSVAHGRVRVEDQSISPAVSEELAVGDSLVVTWGEGARRTRTVPEDVARWRNGELVARDLPVAEVVDAFRSYYAGVIVVREPFASQRVTGLYRLNDPATTLTDMAKAHGATARQISPWVLVLGQ